MKEQTSLKPVILRIFCDISLFLSLFYLPWWSTAILGVVFLIYFNHFYEIIIIGTLADMVYGIPRKVFFNAEFVNTLAAVLLYLASNQLKKFLRRESVLFVK